MDYLSWAGHRSTTRRGPGRAPLDSGSEPGSGRVRSDVPGHGHRACFRLPDQRKCSSHGHLSSRLLCCHYGALALDSVTNALL